MLSASSSSSSPGAPAGLTDENKDDWKLPYKVATWPALNLRAYVTDNAPFWLWSRIHDHCGVMQPAHKFLGSNKLQITAELQELGVPAEQFKYLSRRHDHFNDHSFGTRAVFVMLLRIVKTRGLVQPCKYKALSLSVKMLQASLEHAHLHESQLDLRTHVVVAGGDGNLQLHALEFSVAGLTSGWEPVLSSCRGAGKQWTKMRRSLWNSMSLTSSADSASLWDILIFLFWAKLHPAVQNIWEKLGSTVLPEVLLLCASLVDKYAHHLASLPLTSLPCLTGPNGRPKRLDPVNRFILLHKLRQENLGVV
jgi:hypothetical protein